MKKIVFFATSLIFILSTTSSCTTDSVDDKSAYNDNVMTPSPMPPPPPPVTDHGDSDTDKDKTKP